MRKVGRIKYRFLNEPYLYKLTHYSFYVKDMAEDFKISLIRKLHQLRFSFDISDDMILQNGSRVLPDNKIL